ncbi:MAG: hypothetical protein J2P41_10935 [Blastocatellia bacterium]|nr:hypothetical protein [Blastocatellia bacterium]
MNAYLRDYSILVAVVRPVIVIAVLAGLWVALKRALGPLRSRVTTWLAVAIPLVAWFVLIWTAAAAGVFEAGRSQLPLIPLALILPLVIGLTLLMRSSRIALAIDAVSPSWLVGLQVYRVLGASILALWAYDAIPGVFALPAGIGDVIVGLLALPVAFYLASGAAYGRAFAVAWNFLGIADLVNAVTVGFLSSPGPLQRLALDHPNLLISSYPTVMIPTFIVPLSLILHGLSLWQLWRRQTPVTEGVLKAASS